MVVCSERSSTSSTLLEPVAWSCFRILASKDASRISMVMIGSPGLRVRERVRVNQQKPQRDGTVESHVSQRTRNMGHPFLWSGRDNAGRPPKLGATELSKQWGCQGRSKHNPSDSEYRRHQAPAYASGNAFSMWSSLFLPFPKEECGW